MSMIDDLMGQLQGGGISEISRQLGIDESKVNQVVAGAIPAMVTGLAKTSATSSGQNSLASALNRDHNGSVLDDVVGFLGSGAGGDIGAGILGHVLGNRQGSVNQALGGASGLDAGSVQQILAMLAPLVMGYLGKTSRNKGLDGAGLAAMLGAERQRASQTAPDAMGMLGKLLDSDGDGDVADDVAKLGASLLGGFLGRK
jgi:hypothetical protein